DHPKRHHKPRLPHKGRHRSDKRIPPFPHPLADRSRPSTGSRRQGSPAHHSAGSHQNALHHSSRRLDWFERSQPRLTRLRVREQRTTNPADAPVSLKALHSSRAQSAQFAVAVAVDGLAKQRFELRAFHSRSVGLSVFCFLWHHITCLYVRCRSRASSARPRLIRDLTVPSGTLKAVAISRQSMSCRSLKITASRSSGD